MLADASQTHIAHSIILYASEEMQAVKKVRLDLDLFAIDHTRWQYSQGWDCLWLRSRSDVAFHVFTQAIDW